MSHVARIMVCVGAVAAGGCELTLNAQRVTSDEEKRFRVAGRPELTLATFDGSIRVTSWDRPEVVVTVRREGPHQQALDEIEVKVTQEGNRIAVEAVEPAGTGRIGINQGRSASLVVSVPRELDLSARSGDGSMTLEGLHGRLDLRSGDGSIRASDVSGQLTFRTGDGSIALEGARGRVDLHTGDGSVRAAGVFEAVRVHTGDGGVAIHAGPGSTTAGDWDITTGDGAVALQLPAGFNAVVHAATGDGRIAAGELTFTNREDGDSKRVLRGQLGTGGRRVTVRTGDGSIALGRS